MTIKKIQMKMMKTRLMLKGVQTRAQMMRRKRRFNTILPILI